MPLSNYLTWELHESVKESLEKNVESEKKGRVKNVKKYDCIGRGSGCIDEEVTGS